jgi:hypothetical protein
MVRFPPVSDWRNLEMEVRARSAGLKISTPEELIIAGRNFGCGGIGIQ